MSAEQSCAVAQCDRASKTRGYCRMHYQRLRKHGTTMPEVKSRYDWAAKYEVDESGCWLWLGALDSQGYGVTQSMGTKSAHRAMFLKSGRAIPDGTELDHLCRVHRCVNPDHLEPVTHLENVRRGATCVLTEADVIAIRLSIEPSRTLAERYGVVVGTITAVRSGASWPSVPIAGKKPERRYVPQTHCKRSHEFNEANTRTGSDGRRYCRPCANERDRARRAARAAA